MALDYCEKCDRYIDLDWDTDHEAECHPEQSIVEVRLADMTHEEVRIRVFNSDGQHVGDIDVSDWYTRRGDYGLNVDVFPPVGGMAHTEAETDGPDVVVTVPAGRDAA